MTDIAWLAQEARSIHTYFQSLFYSLALTLLLIGVFAEYFQWPLGGTPNFGKLVGRLLVAAILIDAYPEISNLIADIADGVSQKLGDLNQISLVNQKLGAIWEHRSASWVSVKDNIMMAISYVCFVLVYFSVFVTDAFFLYTWTLLYIFSPVLIALYVLPVTAPATSALFRTLIEVACWKIVWSVLATLLWSAALTKLNSADADVPFLTVICFNLILAGSVLLTPFVVHGLAGTGLSAVTRSVGGVAIGSLTMNPVSTFKHSKAFVNTLRGGSTAIKGFNKKLGNKSINAQKANDGKSI